MLSTMLCVEDAEDVGEGREEHELHIPAPDKFSRAATMQARMDALEKQALLVQAEFEKSFSRDERKLIAAQAYYSERAAVAKHCGTGHGSSTPAILIAARAACVAPKTAENWIYDHVNNEGFFSPSNWGAFPKLASLCGDISVIELRDGRELGSSTTWGID